MSGDDLISDEEYARRLAAIRDLMGPEAIAALRETHDHYYCLAWEQSQACCIDWLLGDVQENPWKKYRRERDEQGGVH